MLVSTLSRCAVLWAFAYDVRWSVRCRRWKPTWWCHVRSRADCSWPRVHVTHPYMRVSNISAFSMRTFRCERSRPHIAQLSREPSAASPRASDPSIDLRHCAGAFVDNDAQVQHLLVALLYLWVASWRTSGVVLLVRCTQQQHHDFRLLVLKP